jgi:hypothetical protein
VANASEKPKGRKKTQPSKEPDPTEEEINAWAERIIGVWDMTSDFSGYLAKVGVRMALVFLIVDDRPTLFANPNLPQKSIEELLTILGKKAPYYSKRAFEIAQSAPTYSAIRKLEKMMGRKEGP